MIAIDANILIYAHRRDSDWFSQASTIMKTLAEGIQPWAIPWPGIHEFLAIVTHQRIYRPPTSIANALLQVEEWTSSPTLRVIGESTDYLRELSAILVSGKIHGPRIHDARIAAICLQHGVRELWSADRDFGRMGAAIKVTNPLMRPN